MLGALVLLVAILLPTIWLLGGLALTFRHILQATQRLEAGDLSPRIRLQTSGEFRQMVDSFNRMVDSLSDTRSKLDNYARQLSTRNLQLRLEVEVRRQAEAAMQHSEHRFHAVFDETFEMMALLDPNGSIQEINHTLLSFLHRDRQSVIGVPIWELEMWKQAQGDLASEIQADVQQAKSGKMVRKLLHLKAHDGHPAGHLDFSMKPILEENSSKVSMIIAECHDISDRIQAELALKESEAQFQQAQKMDAIGRLAGGVAHDFNNLLTSILGFSHLVMDTLKPDDPALRDLMEVVASAERARDLTQKLLTFARKKPEHTELINLNTLLRQAEKLIRVSLHEDIEYITRYGEDIGLIEIDAVSMDQIIVNLAVNARDAMPRSGRLYAQTRRVFLDENFCRKYEGSEPGWYAMLSLRDTGYGMSMEVLERAFEPFFTTKEPGSGTGLGLSTVYEIVQQHKGIIIPRSNPGEGTEFQIYFPEVKPASAESEVVKTHVHSQWADLPTGDETILLVEDEEALRKMGVKLISSLGYKVLTAKDGEEGLEVYTRHGNSVDLIVSDVVMPTMSGPEMIRKIKGIRKDLRFIFVSGFTRDKLEKLGATGPDLTVIQKPYSRETLANAIRRHLDGKQEPAAG